MELELNLKIKEDFGTVSAVQWEEVMKLCEDIAIRWKKVIGEEIKCNLTLEGKGEKNAY